MANQPAEDQNKGLSQEAMEALGLNSNNPSSQNDDSERAPAHSGPLSIELNGKVFKDPESFREEYKILVASKAAAEEVQAMRVEYAQLFQEKMKMLKDRIAKGEKAVKKSFKFKRDPKSKHSAPGIIDILQSFLDEGILTRDQEGRFSTPKGFTIANQLATAANEQIALINKINDIRHRKINGFAHFDKNTGFVYQLTTKEDDITGRPAYEVYNLISLYGKPSIEAKIYSEYEVPNLVQLDLAKMKIRLEERKKNQEKRAKKEKKDQAKSEKKPESQPEAVVQGSEESSISQGDKKAEKQKPKNTMNEEVKELSDAIKADPELKIINQAMGAMLHHQDRVAGVEVTQEQLETILRTAVDYIDEEGVDARDTVSEEDKKTLFLETPKRLADLVKIGISTISLPRVAQSIHEQLEKIKASQTPDKTTTQEDAEVIKLSNTNQEQENVESKKTA